MTSRPAQTGIRARPHPDNGERVPPLCNGDHLDRHEFERRYNAMPEVRKAELIEGVVYMPSPVSFENHAEQHFHLTMWLGAYRAHTPGVRGADNATVRLDMENEPQPEALLLIDPARGGQTRITDGYITEAPELTAEVAASSVSIDRNAKLNAYRRNGVREYLLWRVEDQEVDWFVLRGDHYEALAVSEEGVDRSAVFPGLWLDVAALLRGDLPRVLAVLHQGLSSPDHARFVAHLGTTT